MSWKTLDTLKVVEDQKNQRDEATTSANAGAYTVALGAPLRSIIPHDYEEELPAEVKEYLRSLYGFQP